MLSVFYATIFVNGDYSVAVTRQLVELFSPVRIRLVTPEGSYYNSDKLSLIDLAILYRQISLVAQNNFWKLYPNLLRR